MALGEMRALRALSPSLIQSAEGCPRCGSRRTTRTTDTCSAAAASARSSSSRPAMRIARRRACRTVRICFSTPVAKKSPTYSRAGSFAEARRYEFSPRLPSTRSCRPSPFTSTAETVFHQPFVARQSRRGRAVDEAAVLLMEDAHRHPFADDDEVELPVAVVVDPRRGRHHPRFGELRAPSRS